MLTTLPDGRTAESWLGGAEGGPLVLFFHGCPDTRWAAMTGEAAARAAGVRLLCVNRPGYGSGGAYAVTMAGRHPDRVTALGVVAALPMDATDTTPVDELVERYRAGFEAFVADVDPTDPDDEALATRWLAGLPDQDAALLASAGPAFVAGSVREALADADGYLRDSALLAHAWAERAEDVRCATRLWYGERDQRSLPGGDWFAERIAGAELVVRPGATHWATLAAHWPDTLAWLDQTVPAASDRP